MKRAWLVPVLLSCAACGGRTTLDDSLSGDASVAGDGGVVGSEGGVVVPQDGGVVVIDATVPIADASPPPPTDGGTFVGTIQCGTASCDAATQTCCVTFSGQSLNETCTAQGQCKNGASFDCSSAASCPPNEVCCASFTQTQQGASCAPACQGGFQNPQICATSAECPNGQTCQSSPFGFKVCRP